MKAAIKKLRVNFRKAFLPKFVREVEGPLITKSDKGDFWCMWVAGQDKKGAWYVRTDLFELPENVKDRLAHEERDGECFDVEAGEYSIPRFNGQVQIFKRLKPYSRGFGDYIKCGTVQEMLYFIASETRVEYKMPPGFKENPRPNHWSRHFDEKGNPVRPKAQTGSSKNLSK